MGFGVFLVLYCDGQDCAAEFRKRGSQGRHELIALAEKADWFFFSESAFCSACRAVPEKFLGRK